MWSRRIFSFRSFSASVRLRGTAFLRGSGAGAAGRGAGSPAGPSVQAADCGAGSAGVGCGRAADITRVASGAGSAGQDTVRCFGMAMVRVPVGSSTFGAAGASGARGAAARAWAARRAASCESFCAVWRRPNQAGRLAARRAASCRRASCSGSGWGVSACVSPICICWRRAARSSAERRGRLVGMMRCLRSGGAAIGCGAGAACWAGRDAGEEAGWPGFAWPRWPFRSPRGRPPPPPCGGPFPAFLW